MRGRAGRCTVVLEIKSPAILNAFSGLYSLCALLDHQIIIFLHLWRQKKEHILVAHSMAVW